MRKMKWKKSLAIVMAAAMMAASTGCGTKGGGTGNSKQEKEQAASDAKNAVYAGTELPLEGIEGDISTVSLSNGKIYIQTWEWIDGEKPETSADGEASDAAGEEAAGQTDDGAEVKVEGEEEKTGADAAEEKSDSDGAEEKNDADNAEDAKEKNDAEGEEEQSDTDSAAGQEDADGEETDEKDEKKAVGTDSLADSEMAIADEEYEENGYSVTHLYVAEMTGGKATEIELHVPEDEYLSNLTVDPDGAMYYNAYHYDEKTETSSTDLVKLDADGKEIKRVKLTELLKLGEEDYLSGTRLDAKGNIVVLAEQKLYFLDSDLNSIGELKSDDYLEGVCTTKDGKLIAASEKWSEEGGSTAQVREIDVEGKKWGESYKMETSTFYGSDSLMDGTGSDYDFYYRTNNGIFGYTLADKKTTKVMDYVASNLTSESTSDIRPVGDGRFIGMEYDYSEKEGGTKLVVYEKVDPSTIQDKKIITYGALWIGDDLKRAAIQFNKESKEYQITFKEYESEGEEDPVAKMNAEIVAGNIPDIIDLSNVSVDQYAAKGILEDLLPYFDKDPELNSSDIIDSVLETQKIDGKLYYVAPSFGMSTLVAKKSDVGDGTGWTFDEMKKLLEEKKDARPFYSENKNSMLYSFLGNGLSDFVDWSTGECSFNSQDFKDILEICNQGTDDEEEYSEDAPSMPQLIKEGKVLFVDGWIQPEEVEVYEKMFGGDVSYIGYPNKEKQGSYFQFDTQIGMYAKSEVKDGVWQFLRILMSKDYQAKNMYGNMPTRKDAFDMMMKTKTTTEKYKDEYGNEIEPLDSSWGWDSMEVQIKPLTPEQEQQYRDLVNNTRKCARYENSMMEIVQEEAAHYFAGEKSVDETADIIQNRIKTYVNENR